MIKALQTPLRAEIPQNVTEPGEQREALFSIIVILTSLHTHLVVEGHFQVIFKHEIVDVRACIEGLLSKDIRADGGDILVSGWVAWRRRIFETELGWRRIHDIVKHARKNNILRLIIVRKKDRGLNGVR